MTNKVNGYAVVVGDPGKGFDLVGPYPTREEAMVAAYEGGLQSSWIFPLWEAMPKPEPEPARRRRSRAQKKESEA